MIQDAQELLRTSLANCATFQSFVSAADATAALAKIYHDAWPTPESGGPSHTLAEIEALRPSAIVYTEDESGFVVERDAAGGFDCARRNGGRLVAVLFRNVPSEDKYALAKVATDFRTTAGSIVDELMDQSETAGRLAIQRITCSGPYRTKVDNLQAEGDGQAYELLIEWGVR